MDYKSWFLPICLSISACYFYYNYQFLFYSYFNPSSALSNYFSILVIIIWTLIVSCSYKCSLYTSFCLSILCYSLISVSFHYASYNYEVSWLFSYYIIMCWLCCYDYKTLISSYLSSIFISQLLYISLLIFNYYS